MILSHSMTKDIQFTSCVTNIVTDKQQLVIINLLALYSGFMLLLGLKQPSLSSSYLQEYVNEGHGQLWGVAKNCACLSTSLLQILDMPLLK